MPYFGIGAREFFSSAFFVTGYDYKKANYDLYKYRWYIIAGAPILITIGMKYWQATLLNFEWYEVLPYFITAVSGTLAVFMISKIIVKKSKSINKSLTDIGDNTITILTWHMLSFKLVSLLIIALYSLPIERLAEFPTIEEYAQQGWFVPYTIIGIAIPLILSKKNILNNGQ